MSVEEQMVVLGKLAQQDLRLIELAGVLQQGPKELNQQRKAMAEAEVALGHAKRLKDEAEEARSQCEADLATAVRRLEQAQENAKRITTLEQAEASKVEIAALQKRREDCEAGILSNQESADASAKEIPRYSEALEEAKLAADDLEQQVPQLVQEARTEAVKRVASRERLVKKLEPLVNRMYNIAVSKGGGGPLTTVVDKVCQTCHNTVPPQYLVETIQQKTIHSCTRCKKIIGKVVDTD